MASQNSIPVSVGGSVFESGKDYIARVEGLDPKFGLKRAFIPARKEASRSGRTWSRTATLREPGLYELQSSGRHGAERYFGLVFLDGDTLQIYYVKPETAQEIAGHLGKGNITDVPVIKNAEGKYHIIRRNGKIAFGERPLSPKPVVSVKESPTISKRAAEARFENEQAAVGKGHFRRNPDADAERLAKVVAPAVARTPEELALQKKWFRNPGALDFEGVDTPSAQRQRHRPKAQPKPKRAKPNTPRIVATKRK